MMQPDPAPTTGKRKRTEETSRPPQTAIHIVTGSYERTLHGFVARVNHSPTNAVAGSKPISFSDNFLFNAHASSIRCLAVSEASIVEAQPAKRILATGGADEKINLYQISAIAPEKQPNPLDLSSNRELGSLLHHSATISTLSFPSRGKLVSGALDNTIAVSRVRDWTVLSSINVPIPKGQGRPSGDTAAPGEVPAGINDVAIHPSAKLALSVGQGERCMRLWNLITGKRAGVLTFDKRLLAALGEGRWRRGEARSVLWSPDGEQFALGFERGVLLYGLDCKIRGMINVSDTKICRTRYLPASSTSHGVNGETEDSVAQQVLALSTEDGRVLFYDTSMPLDMEPKAGSVSAASEDSAPATLPSYPLLARLGEGKRGSRIKDFVILAIPAASTYLVITGSSDGVVQVWSFAAGELMGPDSETSKKLKSNGTNGTDDQPREAETSDPNLGHLLGSHQTHKRITCLEAFVLDASPSAPIVAEDSAVSGIDTVPGEDEDEFEAFSEDEDEVH